MAFCQPVENIDEIPVYTYLTQSKNREKTVELHVFNTRHFEPYVPKYHSGDAG